MNFDAISRFEFKPMERETRSVEETIRLSPQYVTMTQALHKRMGKPEYLAFYYDADEKAIGVQITDSKDTNALEVGFNNNGSVFVRKSAFVSKRISDELNVDLEEQSVILRRPYKVEGYFVFELRNADIVKKTKHRYGGE